MITGKAWACVAQQSNANALDLEDMHQREIQPGYACTHRHYRGVVPDFRRRVDEGIRVLLDRSFHNHHIHLEALGHMF